MVRSVLNINFVTRNIQCFGIVKSWSKLKFCFALVISNSIVSRVFSWVRPSTFCNIFGNSSKRVSFSLVGPNWELCNFHYLENVGIVECSQNERKSFKSLHSSAETTLSKTSMRPFFNDIIVFSHSLMLLLLLFLNFKPIKFFLFLSNILIQVHHCCSEILWRQRQAINSQKTIPNTKTISFWIWFSELNHFPCLLFMYLQICFGEAHP